MARLVKLSNVPDTSRYREIQLKMDLERMDSTGLPSTKSLRGIWHDQFDCFLSETDRQALRLLLRRSFEQDCKDYSKNHPQQNWLIDRIAKSGAMPQNPVLVPIMTSGYFYAASMGSQLMKNKMPFDFTIMGCHRGQDTFQQGRVKPFKIYIQGEDEELLYENRKRPALLLDDACETGKTITKVISYMKRVGYKDIFISADLISSSIASIVQFGMNGLYKARPEYNRGSIQRPRTSAVAGVAMRT
jgi:hypoxanthine-guanine phosphoribosyltransferase